MSKCIPIINKKKEVCIGAMNKRIIIQIRTITPPELGGVDCGELITDRRKVWAFIRTVKGETLFNNTSIQRVMTHEFYIRYFSDVTFEKNWIEYKNEYYDIIDVENINLENKYYLISANRRGIKSNKANLA